MDDGEFVEDLPKYMKVKGQKWKIAPNPTLANPNQISEIRQDEFWTSDHAMFEEEGQVP